MTQKEAMQVIQDELVRLKRPEDYPMSGIGWKLAEIHKNAWHVLPK